MDDGATFTLQASDGSKRLGHLWEAPNSRAVMSLVHGFGEHSARYAGMAEYLNGRGISVVALDLKGHGRSDGKRGVIRGFDDFREDVALLLGKTRSIFPDAPHILYGHSMGGGIVLDYGFNPDADIRAIIASAPLINLAEPVPALMRMMAKLMGKLSPKGAMSQPIVGEKISTLKAEQKLYMDDPLNHGQMGFRTAVGLVENGERISAQAQNWTAPLLLLHARDDVLTDFAASEAFAAKARNVSFHAFDHVAHEMHNDVSRAKVYGLMEDFILDHASKTV